jgi:hypothetical protein
MIQYNTPKLKGNTMETKLIKASKAVTFTLNDDVLRMLKELAEKNSNSMSYEIRRLIKDEYSRTVTN